MTCHLCIAISLDESSGLGRWRHGFSPLRTTPLMTWFLASPTTMKREGAKGQPWQRTTLSVKDGYRGIV